MEKVFGRNPVLTALQSGASLEKVFIQDSIHGQFEKEIRSLCKERHVPLARLPKFKIDREVKGKHQGIYALGSLVEYVQLDNLIALLYEQVGAPRLLLLDGIMDVRNLGAIARSAEVLGVHALLVSTQRSAPINEVAIKTSAGALGLLPVSRVGSIAQTMTLLNESGFTSFVSTVDDGVPPDQIDSSMPWVLVVGSEDRGVSRETKDHADHRVTIPQVGQIESLNVSVATAILLYELVKVRH